MNIDISGLLNCRGAKKRYEVAPDCPFIEVRGRRYAVGFNNDVVIDVENMGDGKLDIEYGGEAVVSIPCARCLEEVGYPISFSGKRRVDIKLDEARGDEASFVAGDEIHTGALVADEIMIHWPIRVLCKDECKGLCSRCGANLNINTCDCEKESADPRMAAIKDIFTQFKEV